MMNLFNRLATAALLACALGFVGGCGEIAEQQPIDNWSDRPVAPAAAPLPDGKAMVGSAAELATDGGASTLPAGANKVMKADAYWKLRALIGGLQQEPTAEDLADGLERTRKLIEETDDDQFKPGLLEVLGDVETAWEAHKFETSMKAQGIDISMLPFGTGRDSLESRLSEKYPTLQSELGETPRDRNADSKRAILGYAAAHHASPRAVRSEALARAADKLERVADEIDKWRIDHKDHPIGRSKNPAPGTRPEDVEHQFRLPEVPGIKSPIP